jgi:hypothetical protein
MMNRLDVPSLSALDPPAGSAKTSLTPFQARTPVDRPG